MTRSRKGAVGKFGRDRSGAMSKNKPKQRRKAVSDVGSIIARFVCDDPNCEGDVGKWGPFYMEYIGGILGKNPINFDAFMYRWDNAIVAQTKGFVKSVPDLKKTSQYKQIQEARERWKKEAKKWGIVKWEEKAKVGLEKRQKGMQLRSGKVLPKKLHLKF